MSESENGIIEGHILPMSKLLVEISAQVKGQRDIMEISLRQQSEALEQHAATQEMLKDIVTGKDGAGGIRQEIRELREDFEDANATHSVCPGAAGIAKVSKAIEYEILPSIELFKSQQPDVAKIVLSTRARKIVIGSVLTVVIAPIVVKLTYSVVVGWLQVHGFIA